MFFLVPLFIPLFLSILCYFFQSIIYVNPVINLFAEVRLKQMVQELFAQAKKFDGSYLPPCFSAMPGSLPEENGWMINEERFYRIKWFVGDATP